MSNTRTTGRSLAVAAAVSMTLMSSQLKAQEDSRKAVEEIVVTGSYIKRDRFEAPSPTEVIGVEDLLQSGAPNIGHFVRDLTFTENTDTVANVLGAQDGQQDSNSARFNIRGLGVGSTLTLFDGRRVVDTGAVGSLAPELATERLEVVLDGGAALYGADAVAGVVNVIPIKKFDGYKTRAFYTQDEGGDFDEPKFSMLAGKSFEKLDLVGAVDYSKKSALRRGERPRYLSADDDDSGTGNPGQYQRIGANGLPVTGQTFRDPSCGTFNDGYSDDGRPGNFPSGIPTSANPTTGAPSTGTCLFTFGEFQDYSRPAEEWDSYGSAVYALNDKVSIELQINATWRTSSLVSSPTTANSGNNEELRIPTSNPGNTSGSVLRPATFGWRPFTKQPVTASHFSEGAQVTDFEYITDRYKLGMTYDFGDTGWSGETWVSQQTSRREVDGYALLFDRLQAALNGRGGPSGNEYFNPFGSSDPRSPFYTPARANSQALIDWMFTPEKFEDTRDRLKFAETIVTGDLFALPAGPLAMAVGLQVRDVTHVERPGPNAAASNDYNSSVTDEPPETSRTDSQVNAAFLELSVPILSNVTLQAAVRHEEFIDLNLKATTPKFAIRYEPIPSLALRASYGEGFLAPSPDDVRAVENVNCAEVFTGTDPFTGTPLGGSRSCLSGNPDLTPEESEIVNVGFTWEPLSDLEISVDYQIIEYVDRIQTLASLDLVNRDFARFLAANGLTAAQYTRTPEQLALANSWFTTNADPLIERDPTNANRVRAVTRVPANLSGNEVEAVDLRVRYGFDLGNIGTFSASLSTTYYDRYEYIDFSGATLDAVGKRNGDTQLAPPLPQWKHALRLGWYLGSHSATVSMKYSDAVSFDGGVDTITGVPIYDQSQYGRKWSQSDRRWPRSGATGSTNDQLVADGRCTLSVRLRESLGRQRESGIRRHQRVERASGSAARGRRSREPAAGSVRSTVLPGAELHLLRLCDGRRRFVGGASTPECAMRSRSLVVRAGLRA